MKPQISVLWLNFLYMFDYDIDAKVKNMIKPQFCGFLMYVDRTGIPSGLSAEGEQLWEQLHLCHHFPHRLLEQQRRGSVHPHPLTPWAPGKLTLRQSIHPVRTRTSSPYKTPLNQSLQPLKTYSCLTPQTELRLELPWKSSTFLCCQKMWYMYVWHDHTCTFHRPAQVFKSLCHFTLHVHQATLDCSDFSDIPDFNSLIPWSGWKVFLFEVHS